jgi:UDP-perosamine 4-acetyltransferase
MPWAALVARRRIVILGSNAAARIVAYNLSYDADAEIAGFTDPDPARHGTPGPCGKPILGGDERLAELRRSGVGHAVIAAGAPQLRARLRRRVEEAGLELTNAVHPSAIVSPGARLGRGVVVLAGSVLSDNPSIGDNVWIGLAAAITHDTRIGDDCLIGGRSAVGAECDIGERVLIGWGSVIGLRCRIGPDAAIGSGANVISDIPAGAVAVGNPARVVKQRT